MNRPVTETAHVLMTDRIGYSKLSIEEKVVLDQELLEAVEGCEVVRRQPEGQCLKLDSGDGVSLVFFGEPTDALEAAIHLQTLVADPATVRLRIGLNSGYVSRRLDVNGKINVTGQGIERAQRAMSCADGSRIVMTEFFAENLRAFKAWKDRLVELGDFEIKHGERLRLYGIVAALPSETASGKLAIIYRRRTQPDEYVLELLEGRLPEFGFAVFANRDFIGPKWAKTIEPQIRSAEAVIVLLSDHAAVSEMVEFELRTAVDQESKTGKPRVLPVRIGNDEPVSGVLTALLRSQPFAVWKGPEDDDRLIQELVKAYREPATPLERVGGAMPLDSPYYVIRPTDFEFKQALLERDGIVLVKGARQIGKTSLMTRALREAREAGAQVVWTDLQALSKSQIESDEKLYLALAFEFVEQLGLDVDPVDHWREVLGANTNFERFIFNQVLKQSEGQVIWALDEVDRLFRIPHSQDFFSMLRTWHNSRAVRSGSLEKLTVALAYAREAHLFINDLNQSPFNVGTRLELADFDLSQVAELNNRYNSPLANVEELGRFHALLGGQPYLTRLGLDEMVRHGLSLSELEARAPLDEGPFGDHLRRILVALSRDPELMRDVRDFAVGQPLRSDEAFFRLRAGGVLRGAHRSVAEFRCGLYAAYLKEHLEHHEPV